MAINVFSRLRSGILLSIFAFTCGQSLALTQADLEGVWRISQLITPDAFLESYYNPETMQTEIRDISSSAPFGSFLVDVNEHGKWETRQGSITNDASGNFTGSYTGTAKLDASGTGRVNITTDGETISFLVTPSGSMMVRAARTGDGQELIVLTKNPTNATTADAAGNWQYFSFRTPGRIEKNNPSNRILDLYFPGDFEALTGSITVDSSGNLSGNVGGEAISGTTSTTPDGVVSVTVGDTEQFFLNSTKDVMCKVDSDTNNDSVGMSLLVKLPSGTGTSLAGPWRFVDFRVPNRLVEAYYVIADGTNRFSLNDKDFAKEGEILADTFFVSNFEVGKGSVGISDSGLVSGAATGSFSTPTNGETTLTEPNETPKNFYINASAEFMISVGGDAAGQGDQSMAMVVKVPLESKKLVIETGEQGLELLWLGQSDVKLQSTSNLLQWDDVPGTTGQSGFGINTNVVFFRLLQNNPE